jgi:hypothetical protein
VRVIVVRVIVVRVIVVRVIVIRVIVVRVAVLDMAMGVVGVGADGVTVVGVGVVGVGVGVGVGSARRGGCGLDGFGRRVRVGRTDGDCGAQQVRVRAPRRRRTARRRR